MAIAYQTVCVDLLISGKYKSGLCFYPAIIFSVGVMYKRAMFFTFYFFEN